ncbi:hypothetical protein [Streptomyces sp. NPDC007172]|uniref:hypothetical protein n=1 Tax=unclassified Streptomyces TaxID=2593676 RepID=UPI0036C650A8
MGAEQVLPRPLDFARVRPPAAVAQRYRTDGIGRGTTLDGDLRALTAAQPDRPAFLTGRDGRTVALSYGELDHHIDRSATAVAQLEARPQVVAYQLPH